VCVSYVANLGIGETTVPKLVDDPTAAECPEHEIACPAIVVDSKVTLPGTVSQLKMHVTTATRLVTYLGIARNPKRRGNKSATAVARQAMWPVTATMPTSRSATPAEALATSRRHATKSSATGVARLVMLLCTAVETTT